jgi:hypothetical protein
LRNFITYSKEGEKKGPIKKALTFRRLFQWLIDHPSGPKRLTGIFANTEVLQESTQHRVEFEKIRYFWEGDGSGLELPPSLPVDPDTISTPTVVPKAGSKMPPPKKQSFVISTLLRSKKRKTEGAATGESEPKRRKLGDLGEFPILPTV